MHGKPPGQVYATQPTQLLHSGIAGTTLLQHRHTWPCKKEMGRIVAIKNSQSGRKEMRVSRHFLSSH